MHNLGVLIKPVLLGYNNALQGNVEHFGTTKGWESRSLATFITIYNFKEYTHSTKQSATTQLNRN